MNTFQTIDISALSNITGGVVSGVVNRNVVGSVGSVGSVVRNPVVGSVGDVGSVVRNPVVGSVGQVVPRNVVSSVGV